MKTIVETILQSTKSLIDSPDKWLKGKGHETIDGQDCYCLSLAFGIATHGMGNVYRNASLRLLKDEIDKKYHYRHHGLISFNDAHETRHNDVMEILDSAIKHEQQTPII